MSQCIRFRACAPRGRRRIARGVAGGAALLVVLAGSWGCAPRAASPESPPVLVGAFTPPASPGQQTSAPEPTVPAPRNVSDLTLDTPIAPAPVLPAPDVPRTAAASSAGVLPVSRTMRLSATAYCLRGAMRTGVRTRDGMAAADPRVIPLGSVLRVTHPDGGEVGIFVIMDTGGAIKGNKLDIYMQSCREARRWGRRPVVAEVVDIGQR